MNKQQKTIFIVRHGESEWNSAKSHGNLYRIFGFKDHGLTKDGARQAEELNNSYKSVREVTDLPAVEVFIVTKVDDKAQFVAHRKDYYMALFLNADRIFSSPFTRAIQTTVLSLNGHPALEQNGITLIRSIREIKTFACFDATGIKTGDQIIPRVIQKFQQIVGSERTEELMTGVGNVVTSDVETVWWLPTYSGNEKKALVETRVREFLNLVRNCDAEVPVFVGHSQFFKAVCSQRVSDTLAHNRPEFSDKMRRLRMGNSTVMAITFEFNDQIDGSTEATIVDADFLFGGDFQSH